MSARRPSPPSVCGHGLTFPCAHRLRDRLSQLVATAAARQRDYVASNAASNAADESATATASARREAAEASFRRLGEALDQRSGPLANAEPLPDRVKGVTVEMLRREEGLLGAVERRRESVLQALSAQQHEMVECLATHSESAT